MNLAFTLDNSTSRAVARCSTEAVVRYGLGLVTSEERATLRSGTALHECLAAHFRGTGVEDALTVFDESYRAFAEAHVPADDRLSIANLTTIVRGWLERHPLSAMPFTVARDAIEVGFSFPLDDAGEFTFCGRLDGLVDYQGALYVLEHKSTGRISRDWLAQFQLDSQISAYIWAAQQHTEAPVVGAFLNAIEFSRLPSDSTRRCPKHAVVYAECGPLHANAEMVVVTRAPEEIEEWRKTQLHLAKKARELFSRYTSLDQIQRVRTQGKFNGSCRFCAFREWCAGGRTVEYANNNFVYERWDPLADTRQRVGTAHKP